jgi:hypothetical protein
MTSSLLSMADNLATSDYHQIRENLGLTSGSHSVCLRYHMFTDLYEQLAHELVVQLTGRSADEVSEEQIIAAVSRTDRERSGNRRAWLIHLMVNECMRMQSCIFLWRGEHLHMPRNNLGGNHTKSLTGSPDAIKAVWQMYGAAKAKDPMSPIARARGLPGGRRSIPAGPLTRYLSSDESLDRAVLAKTGEITQGRFQSVQERLGFFAGRCPFTAPPRRVPENTPLVGRPMSSDRANGDNPDRRIASHEQQDDWRE